MSVFDPILNGLLGGHVNAGPLQGVLGSILGGGTAPQSGLLAGLLGGGRQAQQPAPTPQQQSGSSGLMGLIDRFRGAGLGHVADSWVGQGPNQPVAPEQLQQVFGEDQINQWSHQTGMPKSGLLGALAQYLPQAVDHATPNGKLEDPAAGFGSGGGFSGPGIAPGQTVRG